MPNKRARVQRNVMSPVIATNGNGDKHSSENSAIKNVENPQEKRKISSDSNENEPIRRSKRGKVLEMNMTNDVFSKVKAKSRTTNLPLGKGKKKGEEMDANTSPDSLQNRASLKSSIEDDDKTKDDQKKSSSETKLRAAANEITEAELGLTAKDSSKVKKVTGAKKASAKGKRSADESGDTKAVKIPKESAKSKTDSKKEKIPDVSVLDFGNESTTADGKRWNLKLASWNVNGIRAWLEKDGLSYLHHEKPDVMCVQETKCSLESLPDKVNVDGYHCHFLSGDKDGYSGVGLFSRVKPISIKDEIGTEGHNEGRVITAEYEKYYIVAAYVPNSGRGLVRLDYRMSWDKEFCTYLKELDTKKPVILCGDLNVAHEEIDLKNPKTNKKNAGFTKEERDSFTELLSEGFVDTFRHLYPDEKDAYTFWTYMMNARAKNVGWRLDYFIISKRMTEHLCDSVIRKDVFGSDHCPICVFLNI